MAVEYDSLQKEQRRLAVIIPITLLIILALLFTAFNSLRHAFLVLAFFHLGFSEEFCRCLLTPIRPSAFCPVGLPP